MTFEANLVSHLLADGTISGLVGEDITPVVIPEGFTDFPCITYQRVTGIPTTDLDGLDGGLINVRVQIDCWDTDYDRMRQLSEAVRMRLQTAASTFRAVTNFDQDLYEDEAKLHHSLIDASFWYRST